MINIPIEQIKERISNHAQLSIPEIDKKIKDKLNQLSGLISEEGAAHIIANELGVKLFDAAENLQVKGILSGMRNVDLNVKVIQKYDIREFTTAKGPGKVLSMLVGDETGVTRLVLWNKQAENGLEIKDGDVVRIVGGYIKDNLGRKEIHMNDTAKIIINPVGVTVNTNANGGAGATRDYTRKKISQINENDSSVEVLATIVQVFDMNFFEVCGQCNKRVRLREEGFVCPTHDKVNPEYNYVMNLYLDDGSDNVRTVLWREQIESLLGMNRQQVLMFKEDPTRFEAIKHDLLGNMIIVQGKATKNQTFDRIELVASKINKNPDANEEIKKLKDAPMAKHEPYMKTIPIDKTNPAPKEKEDNMDEINLEEEMLDIEDL